MNRWQVERRSLVSLAASSMASLTAQVVFAQSKPDRPKVVIAVGNRASLQCLPLTIAERLDYFGLEGLDVELAAFGSGLRALQAVQDGSGDVVGGSFERTIFLQGRGQFHRAFVLTGRAPQIALGVSTRTMPAYRTIADLKGRKIAVTSIGSTSNMVASVVLARAGVLPHEVSYVEAGTVANALAAVRSGQVDAISHTEPVMTMLEHRSEVRIIGDTRTLKGTQDVFGGPLPSSCLYASGDYVQKNATTVQALTNAVVHALKWLQTAGPSDIIKVVPEAHLLGDRGLYLTSFNKVREAYAIDGLISDDGVRTALRAVARIDPTIRADKIDLGRTFTNEFSRKAKDKFRA